MPITFIPLRTILATVAAPTPELEPVTIATSGPFWTLVFKLSPTLFTLPRVISDRALSKPI